MSVKFDLLEPRTLVAALALFGFLPGLVLKQVVRMYPKGDARRFELVAELYAIKNWLERPLFVAQQFETALTEGVPARLNARRAGYVRPASRAKQLTLIDAMLDELAGVELWWYLPNEENKKVEQLQWELTTLREHSGSRLFARWRTGPYRDDLLDSIAADMAELRSYLAVGEA